MPSMTTDPSPSPIARYTGGTGSPTMNDSISLDACRGVQAYPRWSRGISMSPLRHFWWSVSSV